MPRNRLRINDKQATGLGDFQQHLASLEHMPTVPVDVGKEDRIIVVEPFGYLNGQLPFMEVP